MDEVKLEVFGYLEVEKLGDGSMSDKNRDIEIFFGDPSQGGAQKEELFERSEFSSFCDEERQWVKKYRETRDLSDIRKKLKIKK